jgi:hypothetical protein
MNTLIDYPIPAWVAPAFLSVIFIPSLLLALLTKRALNNSSSAFYTVLGFFGLYFTYVTLASWNGWFNKVFLPPMVLLYCTFPLAIFLFTVVFRSKPYRQLLDQVALDQLVQIHIFRLIGVFFLVFAYHDALPKFFAIVAGLGDMITAVTSIFVAQAIRNRAKNAKTLTMVWNIFGFADIVFTAVTAIVLTKLSIDTGSMGVDTLAQFPFCFIPAFAPPVIIFLHVSIFKKIKKIFG